MVTKAKKALLASLAAFLCVMLTVFGLSMSVSLSETAKAADETSAVAKVGSTTYETLNVAIGAAAEGDTVTLRADTTEDVVIDKNITLDLNGKTLKGTNSGKPTLSIQNGATTTVKNGSIVGSTSYYTIEIKKDSNATATFEDLIATAGNTGSSMIDNWGTLTINSGEYSGGLDVVKSEEGSTLVINGGKFTLNYSTSGYTGVILVYGDTTIRGGEFIQSLTSHGRWNHPQVIATGVVEGYTATTKVTGGSFTNKSSSEGIFRGIGKGTSANFKVSGGTFNKSVSDSYFADGFKVVKNSDGTYGVKVEPLTFDENGICRISTEAELKRFAAMANEGNNFAGKTVYLENDINLNNELWTPIGIYKDSTTWFKGTFDGQNHTITGLKVVEYSKNGVGFFGKVDTGTIKNLTVEGTVSAPGCNYVGGIVGHGYAKITNCTFRGTVGTKTTMQVGGIAGSGGFTITNCSVYGDVIAACWAGGIVGNCQDGGAYTNCYVVGTISSERTFWGGGAAGITPVPLYPSQVISTCYSDTVVKVAGEEVNCPIIAAYNNPLDYNGYTGDLKIYDNSWNKAKNSNDSYPIYAEKNGVGGVLEEGKDVSRDNTLIMLEGDLNYIDKNLPRNKIKIFPGSAVTEETIDNMTVAAIGEEKYFLLQAAIDKAARGATVTLLANTKENVTIAKALTLDLNGYTINGGTVKGKPAVTVTARVTIKDSSEAQTGTIMREDTAENSGVSSHYVIDVQGGGWLMFEGGNVINHSGVVGVKGASLVRIGDDSIDKYPGLTIKGGTFTQDNFIVIKVDRGYFTLNGGTLNSANTYAIENWFRATVKNGTVNGAVSSWTYPGGSNSTLEISGGTINGDVTSVNYGNATEKKAKVSVTGGTITGELDTRSYDPATGELTSINDATKATIGITDGTFSTDPTKYVVEDSAITRNADGTYGVKKAYLAKVGDTSYYTMDEAFKAQTTSGEAIVLLRDYTTGSTFNSGTKHRVVDLNRHTWTYTGTDMNSAAFEINNPNATLTVKNGTIISSTIVGLIPSAMGGTIKYDNAGLVFEGVDMTSNSGSGIETNGNNTNDSVTLKNSTLNVPNGFGIYFPSSGTLTIDKSTINAKTMGVQVCSGTLNINAGSAITVTGDAVPKTENDGAIQDGAAISVVNRAGYKGLSDIVITGGKFTAKGENKAIKAYDWAEKTESTFTLAEKVAVSGGAFTSAVPAEYCANGFIPTQNEDGTYTVKAEYIAETNSVKYETLQAAIDAAKSGATVKLLADTRENVTIAKNITLDLNGYTINGGTGTAKAAITNHGTLTITDSSAAKTGTIKRDDNGIVGEKSYYVIRNLGTMTIEQAKVVNNSGYKKTNSSGSMVGSSLICNGDNDEGAKLTINGGELTQLNFIAVKNGANGTLVVNGGEITSNQSAIQNWYDATINGGTIKGQLWTDAYKAGESVGNTVIGGDVKFTGEIVMDVYGSIKPELTINGGKLSVTNWRITTACAALGGKPAVKGGTFSSEVNKDYLADKYVVNKNTDGTYGVTEGSGFAGANVVVTESLAMKVVVGTASKYVVVTYKGLDGIAKTVRLDKFTDIRIDNIDYKYCLFDQIMPQMIDVKFSFELYGENDVMLGRKANYSVVDYLADIIASKKDSAAFRNVAASLIEYANKAKAVKGLTATVAPTFVDKDGNVVELKYNEFVAANKIPAKNSKAISTGDAHVVYMANVVFDSAYTLKFYVDEGNENKGKYTYKLTKGDDTKDIEFDENGVYAIDILASDITTDYVLNVYYGEDKTNAVQTVTYGVSTYCIRMQESETPQGKLYVASYYYGVAVNQYGTANPNSVQ